MSKYLAWLLLAAASVVAYAADDNVVISRGGVSVTLQDVDTYVSRVPKEQRGKFIDSPQRIRDMLNNMLLTKQLAAQAREQHLDRQPDVEQQLRASTDDVLARARLDDFMKSIQVPDLTELAREQYLTHKDVYKVPAEVDVKHVLIATQKHSDAEAMALAEKVRAEAIANPAGFDALIDKYSEDESKAGNHGLMKNATTANFVQEFKDAADKLVRPNEISPLVHTSFGYHVLQLVERRPERQQTFDEVREQLTASMREQFLSNQRRDFVNRLNNQKDEINPANMDTLRDRYDEAGNVKITSGKPAEAGASHAAPAKQPSKP